MDESGFEQSCGAALEQRSSVKRGGGWFPADGGFVANVPAMVSVRFAVREDRPRSAPAERAPSDAILTVCLTEPHHLPEGVRGTLRLRPDGTSLEPCHLVFAPLASPPRFDGRLAVLRGGREIHCATLRAAVVREGEPPPPDAAPRLGRAEPVQPPARRS